MADEPPGLNFLRNPALDRAGLVKLTVERIARLPGFPDDWMIAGLKTARYLQVVEATPPPLAAALGRSVAAAFVGV
ncbi:DNA cytosine methyltransferase [Kineococcus sp. SYSU DK002]|uniref:DNA cytosine methyltransferase n=1 Tax=Kineococcus sp. SYSU DK002 TaxID=3383123 RepID=UPI003D7D60BB